MYVSCNETRKISTTSFLCNKQVVSGNSPLNIPLTFLTIIFDHIDGSLLTGFCVASFVQKDVSFLKNNLKLLIQYFCFIAAID